MAKLNEWKVPSDYDDKNGTIYWKHACGELVVTWKPQIVPPDYCPRCDGIHVTWNKNARRYTRFGYNGGINLQSKKE